MDDAAIQERIEQLVAEEQELRRSGGGDEGAAERLEELRVQLDRLWDLLRQRRAREEFGEDPEFVHERDAGTVEGYEQ